MKHTTDTSNPVDEYIDSYPSEVGTMLSLIRSILHEEIPGAEDVLSYQIPAVRRGGRNILYYAAWKKHISLYPFTKAMEEAIKEASDYRMSGRGTIQFPLDKPLPEKLIRHIAQFAIRDK